MFVEAARAKPPSDQMGFLAVFRHKTSFRELRRGSTVAERVTNGKDSLLSLDGARQSLAEFFDPAIGPRAEIASERRTRVANHFATRAGKYRWIPPLKAKSGLPHASTDFRAMIRRLSSLLGLST
jgi:hypothetical protein